MIATGGKTSLTTDEAGDMERLADCDLFLVEVHHFGTTGTVSGHLFLPIPGVTDNGLVHFKSDEEQICRTQRRKRLIRSVREG